MEGGDCWAYDSSRTIYNGHFGIDGTDDGGADLSTVNGEAGTMCEGMSFAYSGGNSYIDHINADRHGRRDLHEPVRRRRDAASPTTPGLPERRMLVRVRRARRRRVAFDEGGSRSADPHVLRRHPDGRAGGRTTAFRFALEQNRPNPFNPTTTLAFELPTAADVELAVYNAAGRRVATLVEGRVDAGRTRSPGTAWTTRASASASGVYFFRLTCGAESVTRKGVLLEVGSRQRHVAHLTSAALVAALVSCRVSAQPRWRAGSPWAMMCRWHRDADPSSPHPSAWQPS